MAYVSNLSTRDINVLEKIKDPESNPASGVVLDESLPRDPHVSDPTVYQAVVAKERAIIQDIQKIEMQLGATPSSDSKESAVKGYQQCLSNLDALISAHPNYASARNNRAQIFRRLYGDAMLLADSSNVPTPLIEKPSQSDRIDAAIAALTDTERSIALLSPSSPKSSLSPQAARTLSMAHTQRAAIYLRTAKLMSERSVDIGEVRPESRWNQIVFEEAASRDLALGGRYGNQIAKGLAVSVNPTAKLCGQIVREAMKKEYGPGFEE